MLNSITGDENSAFMKEEELHLVENQLLNAIEDDDSGKLVSLNIHATETSTLNDYNDNNKIKCFLFTRSDEILTTNSDIEFIKKLNAYKTSKIIVLSIFGKIGDGKSHTLNNIIFNGDEIFQTSSEQGSCTKGVHVAYNRDLDLLCFDTEGMPDSSGNENKKTRLLWKILAVSDIIIFRTRSEKLQDDMFLFLGNASKAYNEHFKTTLNYNRQNSTSNGPAIIIFHETINTSILSQTPEETAEEKIDKIFHEKKLNLSAFRSVKYLGVQTKFPPTDYKILKDQIHYELDFLNTINTSKRTIEDFFNSFSNINNKFYNEINFVCPPYSIKILECNIECEICHARCTKSMNHEGEAHCSIKPCTFDSKFENQLKLCKACFDNGTESIIAPNYQNISGDQASDGASLSWLSSFTFNFYDPVINCKNCGDISPKSNWFSTKQSLDNVHMKVIHVWPGGDILKKPPTHPGQKVIDGITSIRETVTNYATEPTKLVSNWVINKVNPSYWRSDEEIINCYGCRKNFNSIGLSKHHCRKCGEGFCDSCTKNRAPVPEYGFQLPSRVCNKCYKILTGEKTDNFISANGTDTMVRRYSEAVVSALKPAGWVYEHSLNYIKYKTKPEYWISDGDSPNCSICLLIFGINEQQLQNTNQTKHVNNRIDVGRHHCRKCGKGVCNNCSKHRHPVPELGWNYDVRICDECYKIMKHKNE